jgi:predicted  nucleic acid-binding Zn-ribbon protein
MKNLKLDPKQFLVAEEISVTEKSKIKKGCRNCGCNCKQRRQEKMPPFDEYTNISS